MFFLFPPVGFLITSNLLQLKADSDIKGCDWMTNSPVINANEAVGSDTKTCIAA